MSLSLKEGFSDLTEEKIRSRRFRLRSHSLGRLGKPLKVLLSLALMALLSYLAIVQMKHLFFGTTYFEVKSIQIDGLQVVKRDDFLRYSGLAPGLNILTFDRQACRARLKRHPWIKEATVGIRGMYTLVVTIEERTPFLYAKGSTAFFEVAEDGVILSTDSFGEKELPIVSGLKVDEKQPGESLASFDSFLEAKVWVKGLAPSLLAEISEIDFSNMHNPSLFLRTGEKVFPSTLDDLNSRLDFLRALLDNLRKNDVEPEYIDLRAPNQIVVKPRRLFNAPEGGSRSVAGR